LVGAREKKGERRCTKRGGGDEGSEHLEQFVALTPLISIREETSGGGGIFFRRTPLTGRIFVQGGGRIPIKNTRYTPTSSVIKITKKEREEV